MGLLEPSSRSNIALVVLWDKPEAVMEKLPEDVKSLVRVAGPLYSREGVVNVVEALAKKFLDVDTVIIFGRDLSGSGEYLARALRGECGDELCRYAAGLGIKVVDLRGRGIEELARAIRDNYSPREPRPEAPGEVPRPRRRGLGFGFPVGLGLVFDDDVNMLLVKAVDYVLTYGSECCGGLSALLAVQLRAKPAGGSCRISGIRIRRVGDGVEALLVVDRVEARELPSLLAEMARCVDSEGVLVVVGEVVVSDVEWGRSLVEARWREAYARDALDPRGNFVLMGTSLLHYYPDSTLYRELPLDRLALRREAAKLLPDHAFYLGEEGSAMALLGEAYEQDAWKLKKPP